MYSSAVEQALQASLAAHAGQFRKGGARVPYVSHPVHVALILARVGVEPVVIQAALLHDVVEDCEGWTTERVEVEFGAEVAALVAVLTEPQGESWEARKQLGLERAATMDPRAATVKAADKLHNLSSLLAALRATSNPEDVWRSFSRGAEQTLATSRLLVEALVPRVDARLGEALLATIDALDALSDSSSGDGDDPRISV